MNRQHVEHLIETMRRELKELDGSEHARLAGIVDELERELAAGTGDAPGLLDRARSSIEAFEVEHPRLTGLSNRVMQTLADIGI